MTKREVKQAVIAAARKVIKDWENPRYVVLAVQEMRTHVRALDELPDEPDLDALNAAVAEALDAWQDANGSQQTVDTWKRTSAALAARREALRPKERYTSGAGFVYDNLAGHTLTPKEVAALLNGRK